jgi:hypothetical protein
MPLFGATCSSFRRYSCGKYDNIGKACSPPLTACRVASMTRAPHLPTICGPIRSPGRFPNYNRFAHPSIHLTWPSGKDCTKGCVRRGCRRGDPVPRAPPLNRMESPKNNPTELACRRRPLLCRFSDAGMRRLSTRCGGRRPKSANARSRGSVAPGSAASAMGIVCWWRSRWWTRREQNASTTSAFWHERCTSGFLMFLARVISNGCAWQKQHIPQPLRD